MPIIIQQSLRSCRVSGAFWALTSAGYSGFRGFIVSSVCGLVGDFLNIGFAIKKPSPALVFTTSWCDMANVEF